MVTGPDLKSEWTVVDKWCTGGPPRTLGLSSGEGEESHVFGFGAESGVPGRPRDTVEGRSGGPGVVRWKGSGPWVDKDLMKSAGSRKRYRQGRGPLKR